MVALVVEAIAYLIILPLRLIGLVGGSRIREQMRQAEEWVLRQAWHIGASGLTDDAVNEAAHRSMGVVKDKEQAEIDLERSTPELKRGPRRIETANIEAPRSEQVKKAMLEAQRLRHAQEQRSGRSLRRRGLRRRG